MPASPLGVIPASGGIHLRAASWTLEEKMDSRVQGTDVVDVATVAAGIFALSQSCPCR